MNCINYRVQITRKNSELNELARKLNRPTAKKEELLVQISLLKEDIKRSKELLEEHKSWCKDCEHY